MRASMHAPSVARPGLEHLLESAFGCKAARPAQKIPTIPKASSLLRGTASRGQYREAMLTHAVEVAAAANDVSTRSCGYPASGPGLLKAPATAWENLRLQHERDSKGKSHASAVGAAARRGSEAASHLAAAGHPQRRRHSQPPARPRSAPVASAAQRQSHYKPAEAQRSGSASPAAESPSDRQAGQHVGIGPAARFAELRLNTEASSDDEAAAAETSPLERHDPDDSGMLDWNGRASSDGGMGSLRQMRRSRSQAPLASHSSLLRALYSIGEAEHTGAE